MSHDHLPALAALMYAAPMTIIALAASQALGVRFAPANRRSRLASLLMMISGAIHIGLVLGHRDEPLLAASFLVAGVALFALAGATLLSPRFQPVGALVVGSVMAAYLLTRWTGGEGADVLGAFTFAIEGATLGLIYQVGIREPLRALASRPAGR